MRVVVLGGGRSSEHDISLSSAEAVRAGLAQAGHQAVRVDISREGEWSEPFSCLSEADVVFPALHGPFGEDGSVQGLLETLAVPYVGAGVLASAVCLDKATSKDVMAAAGLPQVAYAVSRDGSVPPFEPPAFVKPSRLGSSVGISKATTAAELADSVRLAAEHDPVVVVEALAEGLEVECGVIGHSLPQASVPGEIVVEADWYDYEAKYTPGGMELVVPARIDAGVAERVRELAVEVFERFGCSGLARVDFFVEDGGEVLVNELNTMPGFTPTSVFPKLWAATGKPYPELLDDLLRFALERRDAERAYRF